MDPAKRRMIQDGLAAMHQDFLPQREDWQQFRRLLDQFDQWGIPCAQRAEFYQAFTEDAAPGRLPPDELQILLDQLRAFHNQADVHAFLAVAAEWAAIPPPQPPVEAFWSANAAHVQTLYRPWHPRQGYSEPVLSAIERRIGFTLPEPLRSFYRFWGKRADMCSSRETLRPPYQIFAIGDVVVIGDENQGLFYWGLRMDTLDETDPPVYWAERADDLDSWTWQISHPHLSVFLDWLTYGHAFVGGAAHGGYWHRWPGAFHEDKLRQYWRVIELPCAPMGLWPDADMQDQLFIRDGQAIGMGAAVRTPEDLEEIQRILDITWRKTW